MNDLDVWKVRETHHLHQDLEGRRDRRLRCHDSCQNCNNQAEIETAGRHGVEEGICPCRSSGVSGNIGRLADIGKQKTWVCQAQPGDLNGAPTESAQVSKQCLDTSKGKEDAAKRLPTVITTLDQVCEGKIRTERLQHSVVMMGQVIDARCEVKQEPDCNDRRKGCSKLGSAEGLDDEQKNKDGTGNPNNSLNLEVRVGYRDTLDGTKDGLSRSKHAISHDKGNTQDADEFQQDLARHGMLQDAPQTFTTKLHLTCQVALHTDGSLIGMTMVLDVGVPRQETVQCKGSSLTIVVGVQDDEDVLDSNNHGKGPDD